MSKQLSQEQIREASEKIHQKAIDLSDIIGNQAIGFIEDHKTGQVDLLTGGGIIMDALAITAIRIAESITVAYGRPAVFNDLLNLMSKQAAEFYGPSQKRIEKVISAIEEKGDFFEGLKAASQDPSAGVRDPESASDEIKEIFKKHKK